MSQVFSMLGGSGEDNLRSKREKLGQGSVDLTELIQGGGGSQMGGGAVGQGSPVDGKKFDVSTLMSWLG